MVMDFRIYIGLFRVWPWSNWIWANEEPFIDTGGVWEAAGPEKNEDCASLRLDKDHYVDLPGSSYNSYMSI